MKTFFATFVISLLFVITTLTARADTAEGDKTLRWVGCGISKKAYLTALAKAYEKKTGIHIDIQGGGATRGIREVSSLSADIGGSCRQRIFSSPEEKNAIMVPVAWDALVVITHESAPIDNISLENLRKIYLGQIKNWKALGGPDRPLQLFARKGKISGVGRTMRKLLFANYDQEFPASQFFDSSGPLEKAVEQTPDSIAMTGISSARKRNVKILKVNGKYPSYENVRSGEYMLYRSLYLAYNKDNPKVDQVRDFIRFASSPEGMEIIRANDTVPYYEGINLMRKKMQESRAAKKGSGLN